MHSTIPSLAVLAIVATAGPSDAGHRIPMAEATDVATLKTAYLACERRAQALPMGPEEYRLCAAIYQELKDHGFSGNFPALLDWYRTERKRDPEWLPDTRPVTVDALRTRSIRA